MRAPLIAAAMLVLAALPATAQQPSALAPPTSRVVVEQAPVLQRLDSVNAKLLEVMRLTGRSRKDRRMLELLEAARAELQDVKTHVAGAPPVQQVPPQPPPSQYRPPPGRPGRVAVQPIADGTLQALKAAIESESFSDNRLAVLRQAVPAHHFLISQAQQVLALYTFSADKLQAMRLLKPRLLDMENAFRLYESFTFSSDKEELQLLLAEQ